MNTKETIQFYDHMAARNFADWFENDALLPTLREFIGALPPSPRVLDLGCGTGGESKRMSRLGARVTGVDLSQESIALARQHVPEAEFQVMDIRNLEFATASFQGIMEAGVLFHFSAIEQSGILERLHEILVEDGLFLSYYREGDYEGNESFEVDGQVFQRYVRKIPLSTWVRQVEDRGFRLERQLDFNLASFKAVLFRREHVD